LAVLTHGGPEVYLPGTPLGHCPCPCSVLVVPWVRKLGFVPSVMGQIGNSFKGYFYESSCRPSVEGVWDEFKKESEKGGIKVKGWGMGLKRETGKGRKKGVYICLLSRGD
jgi:hypothetical protein